MAGTLVMAGTLANARAMGYTLARARARAYTLAKARAWMWVLSMLWSLFSFLPLPAQTSTTHSPPNAMMARPYALAMAYALARAYALAMQPMAAMPAVVGLGCRPPNSLI